LHPNALAVNYPHAPETLFMGQPQVFFNYRLYFSRRNRVEIEDVSDLDLNGLREWVVVEVVHLFTLSEIVTKINREGREDTKLQGQVRVLVVERYQAGRLTPLRPACKLALFKPYNLIKGIKRNGCAKEDYCCGRG
jgi:hypothetical protein